MNRRVNLMTPEAVRSGAVRRHTRLWAIGLPVLLIALAIYAALEYQKAQPLMSHRAALERQYDPARDAKLANLQLRRSINQILAEDRFAVVLAEDRPLTTLLGVVGKAADAPGIQLRIEEFELNENPPAMQLQNQARGYVRLRGLGATGEDVSRFVGKLQSPLFLRVELEATERLNAYGHELNSFTIRCEY